MEWIGIQLLLVCRDGLQFNSKNSSTRCAGCRYRVFRVQDTAAKTPRAPSLDDQQQGERNLSVRRPAQCRNAGSALRNPIGLLCPSAGASLGKIQKIGTKRCARKDTTDGQMRSRYQDTESLKLGPIGISSSLCKWVT